MARPERNTVDYYPHMVGDGKKMFFIENKYGNDGYATWHKILEKLCSTDYHYLDLNKEEEVMYLAAKCRVEEIKLLAIISDLARLGSFDKEMWDNKIIWCEGLVKSINDAYNKRNNECMSLQGLRLLLHGLGVLKQGLSVKKQDNNPQSKVEYTKEDNISSVINETIAYLISKSGKSFKPTSSKTQTVLRARINENYGIQDFKKVIDNKCEAWLEDSKMNEYIRPETLFGSKFDSYLANCGNVKSIEYSSTKVIQEEEMYTHRKPVYTND